MKITYSLDGKYHLECVLNINQSISTLIDMFSDEIDFEINKIEHDLDYLHEKLNGFADSFIRSFDDTTYIIQNNKINKI